MGNLVNRIKIDLCHVLQKLPNFLTRDGSNGSKHQVYNVSSEVKLYFGLFANVSLFEPIKS